MKQNYEPQELVDLIKKTSLTKSKVIETTYDLSQAVKARLGNITNKTDEFWNERRIISITRFISALISKERVRKEGTEGS